MAATPGPVSTNKLKEEVAEHDDDFYKKYDEDLNTNLIFVNSLLVEST